MLSAWCLLQQKAGQAGEGQRCQRKRERLQRRVEGRIKSVNFMMQRELLSGWRRTHSIPPSNAPHPCLQLALVFALCSASHLVPQRPTHAQLGLALCPERWGQVVRQLPGYLVIGSAWLEAEKRAQGGAAGGEDHEQAFGRVTCGAITGEERDDLGWECVKKSIHGRGAWSKKKYMQYAPRD
jgi:hypothetical protein